MKPGRRALGIAESYAHGAENSHLAGAVVRADRVFDGAAITTCTVGGTDVTESVIKLYEKLDREDIRYILVSGVALAWYNILDPAEVAASVDRPVVAVTYEASSGLTAAIRQAFDGETCKRRLDQYQALPERHQCELNDETVFYRAVGIEPAATEELLRAYTPTGGRPEPLRVARLLARSVEQFQQTTDA